MKEWSHGQECKLQSFNYHCALSWEKSPAVKRLIVFESPSEGRKWTNRRDNWAADSWVDYGLRRLSKGEKKRGERGMKERRKGRGVRKAHVVRCSRRAHLAFLGRGRTPILFGLQGDPWPLACSSLLQVQGLTASSLHTDTHCKLIFHTLWKDSGGGGGFFFFVPFYCHGLKIQSCLLGECCGNIRSLFIYFFFFLKYFPTRKWMTVFKPGKKRSDMVQ